MAEKTNAKTEEVTEAKPKAKTKAKTKTAKTNAVAKAERGKWSPKGVSGLSIKQN